MAKAFQYRFPRVYSFGIGLVQVGSLRKLKYVVGKNTTVLEPACGLGRNKKYFHPSVKYSGFDLNKEFISYGKRKGINLKYGNMFDKKCYKKSDVILLCDIVHHLSKKSNKELFLLLEKFATKKIIILEPRICTLGSKKNIFSRMIAKFYSWSDYDGINRIDKWFSNAEYHKLFKDFYKISSKVKSYKVSTIGIYYLVEYEIRP